MFSSISTNLLTRILAYSAILLLVSWVAMSSAENLNNYEADSLPYVKLGDGSNLLADAAEARDKQVPILLFFSMEHCPFCIEVEEDYLKPILRNAEYDDKVIIRKVKIDDSKFVHDFAGKDREADEFSEQYNVSMVPTIVLVDATGKKIAPSLVGIKNAHYYSAELDEIIDSSIVKLRAIAKR